MSEPTREVGLGLGSNIGDKAGHIRAAVERLSADGIVEGVVLSALYRTAPWGKTDQDWFINACLVGRTRLAPDALLVAVKAIEQIVGRRASERWGPRVIDIDLLYVGDIALDTPGLTLPHRDLANRAFVLAPLADLRPALRFGGVAVTDLLARLGDQGIERLDGTHA
jgi:2-amino-4-hydroxy-6-hydroxymethyldihydropteridine diphosphokinase